jgi:hypothetical protein
VIPEFKSSGLLPLGVHWAEWSEIVKRYGTNVHRQRLLSGLDRGLKALKNAGCPMAYVDGSFVTDKDFPKDYDVCYETVGVTFSMLDPVFHEFANHCAAQKAKYRGEFRPAYVRAEGPPFYRLFFNFFQIDKDTGGPKGIVGIKLIT